MKLLYHIMCLLLMAPALCHAQGSVGYSYDALGRITSTDADGEVTAYTYGSTGNGTMRLTGVSNDSTSVTYTYNPYGWVTQETRSIAGESDIVFEYTYDSYGRLSEKECQPMGTVSYVYDRNGCLKQYRINDDTQWTLMEEYGTETVFYTPTMIAREYHDSKGFLSELSLMNMADTVHHMTFTHDGTTGNLTRRTGMSFLPETFLYDPLDRLLDVRVGNLFTQGIIYDDNGNIMEKMDVGEYTYDTQRPHAVVSVDNSMGEIPDDTQSVTYNAYGKISHIKEGDYATEFLYGPDGQRWRTLTWRNDTLIRKVIYAGDYERVTEGDSLRHFYYGEGNALCVRSGSQDNRYYYVCSDNLASVVRIVDDSGVSVFEATYDAWGRQTVTRNDIGFLRGYTGHEMMPEYGLINMNGRLYDPILGRFLSPDNYVQLPDFSQSFNRYSYCLNNPLKYVDPDGDLFWEICLAIVGAYIGGVSSNHGELNPGHWNYKEATTWLGMGIGAVIGGYAGYGIAHPGSVGFALGVSSPLGNVLISAGSMSAASVGGLGAGTDWKFNLKWTTVAGGEGTTEYSPKEINRKVGKTFDDAVNSMKSYYNTYSNSIHNGLDAAGLFLDFADGINALLYTFEGDYTNAGISATAMVPVLGVAATGAKGFKTYNKFKKVYGKAGEGMEWHHIVEQRPFNINRFGSERIQHIDNMIQLPTDIHRKISGHYSSRYLNSNLTIRKWLDDKSFEFQYEYGKKILKRYGY